VCPPPSAIETPPAPPIQTSSALGTVASPAFVPTSKGRGCHTSITGSLANSSISTNNCGYTDRFHASATVGLRPPPAKAEAAIPASPAA